MKHRIHSFTPFTRTDWYGLSGAAAFSNGQAPLLSDQPMTLWDERDTLVGQFTVILDDDGICFLENAEDPRSYLLRSRDLAKCINTKVDQATMLLLFDALFPTTDISLVLILALGGVAGPG